MKAKEFDKKFDKGSDIFKHLEVAKAKRPGRKRKKIILKGTSDNPPHQIIGKSADNSHFHK
jgi:hypothetical protein